MDYIAFDAKPSMRSIDSNGFMHVKISPFTKEQVVPYYGREIPGWEELKLDPQKVYMGYRPAEELKKPETINSINGIPVQYDHHPDFATDPAKDTRVGAAGTDAEWRDPYLMNSLTIYDRKAQKAIESGYMRELSLAYQYRPDFTPGEWNGKKYDFIMRDIRANHVALVAEGRAGSDVLVYDSATAREEKSMDDTHNIEAAEIALVKALLALHQDDAGNDLNGAVDGIVAGLGDKIDDDQKAKLKKSILALGSKFGQGQDKCGTAKDEDIDEDNDDDNEEINIDIDDDNGNGDDRDNDDDNTDDNTDNGNGDDRDDDDDDDMSDVDLDDIDDDDDRDNSDRSEDDNGDSEDDDTDLGNDESDIEKKSEADTEKADGDDDRMKALIAYALKACGMEGESDDVKKAFIAGIKYGDKQREHSRKPGMAHDSASGYMSDLASATDVIEGLTAAVRAQLNSINSAAEDVKSVLGKVKIDAYDSADDVYMDACKQLGINCSKQSARDSYNAFMSAAKAKQQMAADSAAQKRTVLNSVLDKVNMSY